MAKKEKKQYMRIARTDEKVMPDTQNQGWGQIRGAKTKETITEVDGVRTILREGL